MFSVRFLFLSKAQSFLSLMMVVVRCVLARLDILLVGKSGSVFAERVCFLISSRYKKFALYNF